MIKYLMVPFRKLNTARGHKWNATVGDERKTKYSFGIVSYSSPNQVKQKIAYFVCRCHSIILPKILFIVVSWKSLMVMLLKWRKNRGVTGFLPPPGGPMAPISWTSTRCIGDVSFRSYLKHKIQSFILHLIIAKNSRGNYIFHFVKLLIF